MTVKLTEDQQAAFGAILWLIDGPRGAGRSTVLALAFLAKAVRNPGQWVRLFDHETYTRDRYGRYLFHVIDKLWGDNPLGNIRFKATDYAIKFEGPELKFYDFKVPSPFSINLQKED